MPPAIRPARFVLPVVLLLADPARAAAPLTFGGWMDVFAEVGQVVAHPQLFDSISLGMYGIRADGTLHRNERVPDRTALVGWARRHGIRVDATLGGEPKALPAGISGTALDQCLREVAAVCAREGFGGVDVDIEELPPSARAPYTHFIERLRGALAAMAPPCRLSVTLQCFQNAKDEAASFLDYAVLAGLADEVRVMHYTCPWGEPGPIMPRAAFAESVAYARSRIPAEKYVAAVPWYGDDWDVKAENSEDVLWQMTETATGIMNPNEMTARFGGRMEWREPEGELHYSYTLEGKLHEVWMPDARTFAWMVDDVKQAGATGIYAYQLEYADPSFLEVVDRKIKH